MVTILNVTYSYFNDLAISLGLITESEITKTTEPIKALKFEYLKIDIFTEVNKRTSFMAKLRSTDVNLMNLVSLSQDEKDLFEPFYLEVIREVERQLQPLSKNIIPSCIDQEDWKLIYYTEQLKWMNPGSINMIDNYLFNSLVFGIMFKWFTYSYPQEAQNYQIFYQNKLTELSASLNSTNTTFKRKYTYP